MGKQDVASISDSSSEEDRKKKKELKKKDKKSKKEKSKKRKASSSSSASEAPAKKKSKKEKEKKDKKGKKEADEKLQDEWITKREKALRKENPGMSKDEALGKAVEEFVVVFAAERAEAKLPVAAVTRESMPADLDPQLTEGPVAEALAESDRTVREEQLAKGKTEEQIENEVFKARAIVLRVAAEQGLYKPPSKNNDYRESMFMDQIRYEQAEAKRLAPWRPTTDDGSTQILRNERDRLSKEGGAA